MKKLLCLLLALVMALSLMACGGNAADDAGDEEYPYINPEDPAENDGEEDTTEESIPEDTTVEVTEDTTEETTEEETTEEPTEETTEAVVEATISPDALSSEDLVGTWAVEVPYVTAELLAQSNEIFEDFEGQLNLTFVMEFSEDGIATMYVDEDAYEASVEAFEEDLTAFLVEYLYAELEAGGYSREESDEYFQDLYQMSAEELCAQQVEAMGIRDMLDVSELRDSGSYELNGDQLTVGVFTMTVAVGQTTLTVLDCDQTEYWEQMGFQFPTVLTRVN